MTSINGVSASNRAKTTPTFRRRSCRVGFADERSRGGQHPVPAGRGHVDAGHVALPLSSNRSPVPPLILPRFVYIQSRDNKYLSVKRDSNLGILEFSKSTADHTCLFEPSFSKEQGGWCFKGYNDGWFIRIRGRDEIRCNVSHPGSWFKLLHIAQASGGGAVVLMKYNAELYASAVSVSDDSRVCRKLILDEASEYSKIQLRGAILKQEIYDIRYNIDKAQIQQLDPHVALNGTVVNDLDHEQKKVLSYSYTKSEVGTWNHAVGAELGFETTFKAGVPFIAEGGGKISVSASYTHQWGKEVGTSTTVTATAEVTVKGNSKAQVTILVKRGTLDVHFTYKRKVLYANGVREEKEEKGIYHNVDSYHVHVHFKPYDE